jgi:hypothetical protein
VARCRICQSPAKYEGEGDASWFPLCGSHAEGWRARGKRVEFVGGHRSNDATRDFVVGSSDSTVRRTTSTYYTTIPQQRLRPRVRMPMPAPKTAPKSKAKHKPKETRGHWDLPNQAPQAAGDALTHESSGDCEICKGSTCVLPREHHQFLLELKRLENREAQQIRSKQQGSKPKNKKKRGKNRGSGKQSGSEPNFPDYTNRQPWERHPRHSSDTPGKILGTDIRFRSWTGKSGHASDEDDLGDRHHYESRPDSD